MLVLTRKTNQSIMIGDNVEISILSVAGDKVRLGIDAPRDVEVFRKEVFNSREAAAKAAADGSPDAASGSAATDESPQKPSDD